MGSRKIGHLVLRPKWEHRARSNDKGGAPRIHSQHPITLPARKAVVIPRARQFFIKMGRDRVTEGMGNDVRSAHVGHAQPERMVEA